MSTRNGDDHDDGRDLDCVRFTMLSEHARIPFRSTLRSVGFDLSSAHTVLVPAKGRKLVFTDLSVALPRGCYGRIAPRSGMAVHHGIDVGAGVVDADYTGNVGVVLFNHGHRDHLVQRGDRIAQLICERVSIPKLRVTNGSFMAPREATDTGRGARGLGRRSRDEGFDTVDSVGGRVHDD